LGLQNPLEQHQPSDRQCPVPKPLARHGTCRVGPRCLHLRAIPIRTFRSRLPIPHQPRPRPPLFRDKPNPKISPRAGHHQRCRLRLADRLPTDPIDHYRVTTHHGAPLPGHAFPRLSHVLVRRGVPLVVHPALPRRQFSKALQSLETRGHSLCSPNKSTRRFRNRQFSCRFVRYTIANHHPISKGKLSEIFGGSKPVILWTWKFGIPASQSASVAPES
jgi:hypothetical protein